MCEAAAEATHVWSSKPRIAVFIGAMRQFAAARRAEGWAVCYHRLQDQKENLLEALKDDIGSIKPQSVHVVEPGEWRLREGLLAMDAELGSEMVR